MPVDSSTGYIPLDGSSHGGCWGQRSSLERGLILTVTFLTLVAITLIFALAFKKCEESHTTTVAPTTETSHSPNVTTPPPHVTTHPSHVTTPPPHVTTHPSHVTPAPTHVTTLPPHVTTHSSNTITDSQNVTTPSPHSPSVTTDKHQSTSGPNTVKPTAANELNPTTRAEAVHSSMKTSSTAALDLISPENNSTVKKHTDAS